MQKGDKILHIMNDENFVDYFIQQSEKVFPELSDYWIISSNIETPFQSAHPKGNRLEWNKNTIPIHAQLAGKYKKIILHSFFINHLEDFFKYLHKHGEIIWVFWGGDGYSFASDIKRWYLPLSWKKKVELQNSSAGFLKRSLSKIKSLRNNYKKSALTRSFIKSVDTCATWVKYDYELVKEVHPELVWKSYSYFTFEQMDFSRLVPKAPDPLRLFLGNSATDTNNHFDALNYLKEIGYPGSIIVPLSYGNDCYAAQVMKYGEELFKEKFVPVREYLNLDKYHDLMNSCGIVWMNHKRQQAAGNIIASLFLGRGTILHPENTIYRTFNDLGVKFLNKEKLKNPSAIDFSLFSGNAFIIESFFSIEKILEDLKNLYA